MIKRIAVTDSIREITEIFSNPPWHLISISEAIDGSILAIQHKNGDFKIIHTTESYGRMKNKFSSW